jgi:hypothetical protein
MNRTLVLLLQRQRLEAIGREQTGMHNRAKSLIVTTGLAYCWDSGVRDRYPKFVIKARRRAAVVAGDLLRDEHGKAMERIVDTLHDYTLKLWQCFTP